MTTKPKRHRTNPGGRPSNRARLEELQTQVNALRGLLVRRTYHDETWELITRFLNLVSDLEELSTPLQAATYDNQPGHTSDPPLFPGVQVTPTGLRHGGSYAENMNRWVHRHLEWVVTTAERRFKNSEPDPKPQLPRR